MARTFITAQRGTTRRAAAPVLAAPGDRRKRVWARFVDSNAALSELEYTADLLSDLRTTAGITINMPGVTIGRIRFKIQIRLDFSVTAASATSGVVVGVYTQSQQATGGRLSAASDLVDDYLYWSWHPVGMMSPVAGALATDQIYAFEVDSKAMRKMDEFGTGLFMNVNATGSTEIDEIMVVGSVLLILP